MAKLIAIDDGHGMETSGKRTPILPDGLKSETGNFMHENEFNRAVAKYLKVELERCGFRTVMVAPTDTDTSLATRVATANNSKADFYVSIHANANTGSFGTWGGTETFAWSSGESLRVGKIVHKHVMGGTSLRDRGVKNGDWLYVLKNTNMPAILIEAAYMDNLNEAKLLLSDAFRRETAREVAQGLCEAYGVPYKAETVVTPTPTPVAPANLYRVRKSWEDTTSQIGAFSELDNAIALAQTKTGYRVYDKAGKQVWPVNQMYRVRKTWADAASQIGAFAELANAKECADKNPGYTVYDVDGKAVYVAVVKPPVTEPTAPVVAPTPTPTPEPVPTPVENHDGHHAILGSSTVTAEQMIAFVKTVNPDFDKAIAPAYLAVGKKYGVRGDLAFCQSIIETGWFKFDGGTAVTPDQHNYCGMGVTSKGMKGNSFNTIEDGVTAQLQHLFAYASKAEIPTGETLLDPRFKYVTRGIAPHWEDLNNRWAMNSHYGQDIVALYQKLLATPIPKPEPEPTPEPVPVPVPEPEPVKPEPTPVPEPLPVEEEKVDVGLLNKVLKLILDFLTGWMKK